jgi:hypothetical protein
MKNKDYFDPALVRGRRCLILFDDSQKAYENIILKANLSNHPKVIWCPSTTNHVSIQPKDVEKLQKRLQVIFCQKPQNEKAKASPFYIPWNIIVNDAVSGFMSWELIQKCVPIFQQQSYSPPAFAIEKRDEFLRSCSFEK